MAGVKGRSGRRAVTPPEGLSLPPLGDDEASVLIHTAALSVAVQSGALDPRIGDTLQKVAIAHLRALTQRAGRSNILERVRKLDAKYEELDRQGKEREEADRQHRTGADSKPAVWDDDDLH